MPHWVDVSSRVLVWVASVAAVLVVLAVSALALLPRVTGWNAVIVLSGSMEPELKTGGLAFVEPVPEPPTFVSGGVTLRAVDVVGWRVANLEVGDVIAFRSPNNPARQISHRIIEVIRDGEGLWFRTKGDNSALPDQRLVPAANVVGTIRYDVPYLGYVADWMRHRDSYYLMVGIPAVLVIAAELVRIFREIRNWRAQRADAARHPQTGIG
jgi:signal peptidase